MAGFAEIVTTLIGAAERIGRPAVTTIGRVLVEPNGASIIPGKIRFTVDARHRDLSAYRSLCATHEQSMHQIAQRRGLGIDFRITTDHQPCPSDGALVEAIEAAAGRLGVPCRSMASGAGHDSQQMAKIARTAMIFVRSKDGRSNTPEEFSSIPDIVAGNQRTCRNASRAGILSGSPLRREIRADRAQAAPSSSESRRLRARRSRTPPATPLCRSCPAYRRGEG